MRQVGLTVALVGRTARTTIRAIAGEADCQAGDIPPREDLISVDLKCYATLKEKRAMTLLKFESDPNNYGAVVSEFESKTGIMARSLALQFDTLGCDCIFGFIQRYCDAEPLSLFRFSHISLPNLLVGLKTDFAGLSDPKNLVPILRAGTDWDMHQTTYHMNWHTFLHKEDISEQELISKQAKSLEYLRIKLLEDIANGDKTFVLWRTEDRLTEEEVAPLYETLRSRGNCRLLWVVQDAPSGQVSEIHEGLMRGNVDRWSWLVSPGDLRYSMGAWLNVLLNASSLSAKRSQII